MDETESTPQPSLKTTVLIVTLNCEEALRRSLTALAASAGRESFEVLTVDCGSRDGSPRIDSEFSDITVLRLPRNFGRTKARNIGIRTAKGEFILLLEPGVEVASDMIPSLAERLETDHSVVAVAPILVDKNGAIVSRSGQLPDPEALAAAWVAGVAWEEAVLQPTPEPDEPLTVECPDPAALLVRSQAIKGMNYFDERYGEFGSDLELYTQAYKASKKILVFPGVRAVRTAEGRPAPPAGEGAGATISADFANGVIAYTEKHYGWTRGMKIRLKIWLRALLGLHLGMLNRLVSGQRIDGSQLGI